MFYDLIIIGSGPAGLTAAIYALRYSLKTLVLGEVLGGRIVGAAWIENWPGERRISGMELGRKMLEHAKVLGVDFRAKKALKIKNQKLKTKDDGFEVVCEGGEEFTGRAVLIATGTAHRRLGVPGEKEFTGRGVSYCATCDAAFFKNKTVAVVGGGDSAVIGALNLADVAKRIYLIHRRKEFRAKPDFVKKAKDSQKIEFVLGREVVKVLGEGGAVSGVELNETYQGQRVLKLEGVFFELGSESACPLSSPLGLETDKQGYIKVGQDQATSVKGVFAAGDATTGSNYMRQIITAAAEGAIAAKGAYEYLRGLKIKNDVYFLEKFA